MYIFTVLGVVSLENTSTQTDLAFVALPAGQAPPVTAHRPARTPRGALFSRARMTSGWKCPLFE